MKEKLIIIDGNALIHRAFHALPDTLKTSDGKLTNAVYGFLLVFLKVLDDFSPKYAAAAFDRKGATFRHKAFSDYKAKRVRAPDELYEQIPLVKKALKAFGVPIFSVKGLEADDVVGAIAKKVERKSNLESIIVTGDLDTLQLVDSNTKVFTLRRGTKDTVLYGRKEVVKKMGVTPEQIVDYKALAGDASDNIPGVAGVGPKTAVELLGKYKDLAGIYKNLGKIKETLASRLEKSKKNAFLSQRLARIQTGADPGFDLDEAKFGDYNREEVKKVLEELEFKTLLKRLGMAQVGEKLGRQERAVKRGKAKKLFGKVIEVEKKEELKGFLKKIVGGEEKVFVGVWERPVVKAFEKSVFDCQLKYLGVLGEKNNEVLLLNLEGKDEKEKRKLGAVFLEGLRGKVTVFFSGKQELEVLEKEKIRGWKVEEDVKVMAYLIGGGKAEVTLEALAKKEKLALDYFSKMLELKKGQPRLLLETEETEKEEAIYKGYLCQRLGAACFVFPKLWKELADISALQERKGIFPKPVSQEKYKGFKRGARKGKYSLEFIYREIEIPLIEVLKGMEMMGVKIDEDRLRKLKGEYQRLAKEIKKKVMKLCGQKFNLDSSQQLSRVFYEKLGFSTTGIKKGKSGFYSTSADALEILAREYEVARLVLRYRELTKLVNTYIEPLPRLVNEKTGRLHTQFNQEVTATGRLSSSNPNLQNIPIRTPEGQRIREAFVAEAGFELLSADYSQIELRVAAHYSGDKTMLGVFREGGDIHTETAAKIHGLKKNEVSPEVRRTAKELNFGLIYGMGAYGFSRSAKITMGEAKEFIAKYKEKFPKMFSYLEEARKTAKEKGYVETMFGRRRQVPEIHSRNWNVRSSGERMAINMPLQGTAADIMKLAMIQVESYLKKKKLEKEVKMLLSVHDEILFEVRKEKVRGFSRKIKAVMEGVVKLAVPLEVEMKRGKSWGKMKKV